MRGATPYGLRGTPLAIPRGTLANPSLRFGRERSGLYRSGDGILGLGIKAFKALEVTGPQTTVFSNSPGAGSITPLGLARVNATTADGQETGLTVYEVGLAVARLAAYRQTAGKYGWKLSGLSGGSLQTGLTVDGDGNVAITGTLSVGGAGGGGTIADSLTLTGAGTALTVTNNATIGGQLTLSRAAGQTALNIPSGDAIIGGNATITNRLGLGTTAPAARLHAVAAYQYDGVIIGCPTTASTFSPTVYLVNHAVFASSTVRGWLTLSQTAGDLFAGSAVGDLGIGISGGTGKVWLGAGGTAKLILDPAATGIRFMHGATEQARLTTGGRLGIGTTAPDDALHVVTAFQYDGLTISAPLTSSTNAPTLYLLNHAALASATRRGWLTLGATVNDVFGSSAVGDLGVGTSGSAAGRLLLGSRGILQMILDSTNGIYIMSGATELARWATSGWLGLGTNNQQTNLHIIAAAPDHGIRVSAVNTSSTNSPSFSLQNAVTGMNRGFTLGLALSAGHFMGSNVGDACLVTNGANAGDIRFGTNSIGRLRIKNTGNGGGVDLTQGTNNSTGGLTIARSDSGTPAYLFVNVSGDLCLQSNNGQARVYLSVSQNMLAPDTDNSCALGNGSQRWSDVRAVNMTTQNLTVVGSFSAPGTGAGTVPLNGVIMFRFFSELTAAGSSWVQDTSWDGRMPMGVGTSAGQSWGEWEAKGSNWTPASGLSLSGNTTSASVANAREGSGANIVTPDHSHNVPDGLLQGRNSVWLPPSRGTIFARRVS